MQGRQKIKIINDEPTYFKALQESLVYITGHRKNQRCFDIDRLHILRCQPDGFFVKTWNARNPAIMAEEKWMGASSQLDYNKRYADAHFSMVNKDHAVRRWNIWIKETQAIEAQWYAETGEAYSRRYLPVDRYRDGFKAMMDWPVRVRGYLREQMLHESVKVHTSGIMTFWDKNRFIIADIFTLQLLASFSLDRFAVDVESPPQIFLSDGEEPEDSIKMGEYSIAAHKSELAIRFNYIHRDTGGAVEPNPYAADTYLRRWNACRGGGGRIHSYVLSPVRGTPKIEVLRGLMDRGYRTSLMPFEMAQMVFDYANEPALYADLVRQRVRDANQVPFNILAKLQNFIWKTKNVREAHAGCSANFFEGIDRLHDMLNLLFDTLLLEEGLAYSQIAKRFSAYSPVVHYFPEVKALLQEIFNLDGPGNLLFTRLHVLAPELVENRRAFEIFFKPTVDLPEEKAGRSRSVVAVDAVVSELKGINVDAATPDARPVPLQSSVAANVGVLDAVVPDAIVPDLKVIKIEIAVPDARPAPEAQPAPAPLPPRLAVVSVSNGCGFFKKVAVVTVLVTGVALAATAAVMGGL